MDVVSAFASLFGLTINVKKLRLLSTAGLPVVVYSHSTTWVNGQPRWTPRRLVVAAVGSVKYLGLEIDIDGSGKTQLLTTKTTARKLAAVISTRVASPTVKYAVARSSIMAKLAYPLRFSCWRLSK